MKDEIDKHKITKKKINGKRFRSNSYHGQCMNNYEYVDDFNRLQDTRDKVRSSLNNTHFFIKTAACFTLEISE